MVGEFLHLVVHDEGDEGVWMVSPQVPGLVFGRPTFDELRAELDEVLEFAGAPDLPRVLHRVTHAVAPEGHGYQIVIAQDEHKAARAETAALLLGAMQDDQQRRRMFDQETPRLATGEVMFIAVASADHLDWVTGVLEPHDAAMAVAPVPGTPRAVWMVNVSSTGGGEGDEPDRRVLSSWVQVSPSTDTIEDLIATLPLSEARQFATA